MEAAHHLPLSPLSVTFPTFLIPSFSFLKKMAAFVYYLLSLPTLLFTLLTLSH